MSASGDPPQLDKYRLRELLGGSGITEVWKAFAPSLRRYVAIKILHANQQNDPSFISRFKRDARQIASLHHPNIAHVYDYQIVREENGAETSSRETGTLAYIVMDYIEGTSLASLIRATSRMGRFLSPSEIVHLFAALASAVDYAHEHGVIIGDIKPANILLAEPQEQETYLAPGKPVMTGFGIAKLLGTTPDVLSRWGADTSLYISPEQAMGYAADAASDIYSLGVILYEMLTGRPPFQMNTPEIILQQHIQATPISPSLLNPKISPALSSVILRSLEKETAKRFPTASALVRELAKVLGVPLPDNFVASAPSILPGTIEPPEAPETTETSEVPEIPPSSAAPTFIPENSPLSAPPTIPPSRPTRRATRPIMPLPIDTTLPLTVPTAQSLQDQTPRLPLPSPPHLPPSAIPHASHHAQIDQMAGQRRKLFAGAWHIPVILTLLALLIISSLVVLLTALSIQHPPSATPQIVGHVYFLSSWQFFQNNQQGINDQVQIDLQAVQPPTPGKVYYAWLLGDPGEGNRMWVPLGKVTTHNHTINYLYTGDARHDDLLASCNRFLITEESASSPSHNPLQEPATWRYYAAIPQKNASTDGHFSMLDDLRHLLVQAPELQVIGLSGGLATWLLRNTEEINTWATIARDSWAFSTLTIQQELVNILYYLDGECTWQYLQHVPPLVSTSPENSTIAQVAHFALLNPCLEEQEEQSKTQQNIFGNTPHDSLDHMLFYLASIAHSPDATQATQKQVSKIIKAINAMKGELVQLHQHALQLLTMSDNQLNQSAALALLDDVQVEAVHTLAGWTDPGGQFQAGASWIYQNTQLLATFNVTLYH